MLGPTAQCQRTGTIVERADDQVFRRLLDHGDDRHVLAAEVGDRGDVGKLDRLGFGVDQDDVGSVSVEVRDQFVGVFRARGRTAMPPLRSMLISCSASSTESSINSSFMT
jgi:hypothetical protein